MRKNKLFRPRRGMRFTNTPLGQSPEGMFVGDRGESIEPVDLTGSVERFVKQSDAMVDRSSASAAVVKASDDFTAGVTDDITGVWDTIFAAKPIGTAGNGIILRLEARDDWSDEYQLIDNYPSAGIVTVRINPNFGGVAHATVRELESLTVQSDLVAVQRPSSVNATFGMLSGTYQATFHSGRNGIKVDPSHVSIDTSISFGRLYERRRYDAQLLGRTVNYTDVRVPFIGVVDQPEYDPLPPNNLVYDRLESPSWTHSSIGVNQAFVATAFTSSDHEVTSLNYFRSGTEALESSAVAASASAYYSKRGTYQTYTVKKSASFFDTIVPYSGALVPVSFHATTGSLITMLTGANVGQLSCSYRYPATVRVDVPQSGRIVDLKVWIEVVHSSGSGQLFPLSTLGIAVRSPNVSWGHAHPMRNDPLLVRAYQGNVAYSIDPDKPKDMFYPAVGFYRDTFILWEGEGLWSQIGRGPFTPADHEAERRFIPSWHRDRSIRTVFVDGARVPNPRHLYSSVSVSGNYLGAPNSYFGINHPWGFDVPWTSDLTVPNAGPRGAAGSPPRGWLTAAGGVANTNEWPTTGTNYGAEQIQPMYPLLDPIYQRKVIGEEAPIIGSIVKFAEVFPGLFDETPDIKVNEWKGFRPGLRGTEMSGTWEILFAQAGTIAGWDNTDTERVNAYFRQVRLEFTYEDARIAPALVRNPRRYHPRRGGEFVLNRTSGSGDMVGDMDSGSWDGYVNLTCIDVPMESETGRTFGVVYNTGSVGSKDYALLYRLSGALADISGSVPGWLANNQFGMPAIPISSASLIDSDPVVSTAATSVASAIRPQKILDGARSLVDVAREVNPAKTLVRLAQEFASGSTS